MFIGVHSLIFTKDAEAARAFFRDVLEFPWVNAGDGWLVFALPPTEVGLHPEEGDRDHELHLLCDDLHATVARLQAKGVKLIEPIHEEEWGIATRIEVPGDAWIGIYQPKHPLVIEPASPA
ncbi:MAG: extradiol dioxygenase [Chloroflexi bacterium]|nr:extradiol dioxygenase [Chloroflexota bacterium]